MGAGRILASLRDIWKDHPVVCWLLMQNFWKTIWKKQGRGAGHVKASSLIGQHRRGRQNCDEISGMDEASIRLAMENVNYTPVLSVEGEKEYVDFLTKIEIYKSR